MKKRKIFLGLLLTILFSLSAFAWSGGYWDEFKLALTNLTYSIVPKTDNALDLGSASKEFKDLYIDGTANIDTLSADSASFGATDFTGNITLDDGSGDSPILSLKCEGNKILSFQKLDAGNAEIKNDEGDIVIDPTGVDVLLDAGLTVGSTTQAGDNNLRVEGTSTLVGLTTVDKLDINNTSEPAISISMTSITGTDNQAIDIVGGEILASEEHWTGIRIKPDDLSPSGVGARIRGLAVNLSGISVNNIPDNMEGIRIVMESGLTGAARSSLDALHITEGDIQHEFSVPATAGETFTAYDMIIDSGNLHANSEIHGIDFSTSDGSPSGIVAAIGTHTYVAPVHQHIGTYSTPNQNNFAGKYEGGDWIDGDHGSVPENLNAHEVFKVNGEWIAVGSASVFSEIEVIMTTPGTKTVTPTFWYSTGQSTWTQFYPEDATNGFQQSGLIYWSLGDISGSWTGDGEPSVGEVTAGYWIKILRTGAPDPGTPIPATIKTGTVVLYDWDKTGAIDVLSMEADTITEGGTAVPNTGDKLSVFAATTSAELAGVISNETGSGVLVYGTSPTFTTDITITPTAGDLTLTSGKIAIDSAQRQLGWHDGTVEVVIPAIHYMEVSFDPGIRYDSDAELWLTDLTSDRYPDGIVITAWYVDANVADPSVEMDMNLNYCDAVSGAAFPGASIVLVDVMDTTTGNSTEGTMSNSDLGSGTIPSGKSLYLLFDADPEGDCTQLHVRISYYIPES